MKVSNETSILLLQVVYHLFINFIFIYYYITPTTSLFNLTYYWGGQFKSFNKRDISGELVRAVCAGCAQNCAENRVFLGGGQNWGTFDILLGRTFSCPFYFYKKIFLFFFLFFLLKKSSRDLIGDRFLTPKKGTFSGTFRDFSGPPEIESLGTPPCKHPRYVRMRAVR